MRRHRARLNRQRPGEQRLGRLRAALIEVYAPEPHQRGHVIRPDGERTLERGDGPGGFRPGHVDVPEVIRPAQLSRLECLRVEVVGFGGLEVIRSHQQVAGLSVGAGEIGRWCFLVIDEGRQRTMTLADLLLDRPVHLREIGQCDRRQLAEVGLDGLRCGRGCRLPFRRAGYRQKKGSQDRGGRAPHLPSPSFKVMYRSIAGAFHSSVAPPGHTTRTRETLVAPPSPASTLGSLAEA